jgi:multidrug efflux pump subunit AcrA (membrane-fusion protein)
MRTYPVTLSAEPPVGVEVLPGMVARATIVSRPPAAAREVGIEIPASALRAGGDGSTSQVFVVDESSMTLQAREVNVSLLSNTGVLVKEGLAPSEWLVVAGVNSVKAGQRVRILDAASGVAAK